CHKRVFESDGLRLLRLVRLAAQLGFKIEGETAIAAKAMGDQLNDITTERKRAELDKILYADTANGIENAHYRGLRLLKQLDLWKNLIPEIAECDGLSQPEMFHKYDVMEHSFQCVRYVQPMTNLRLAALLHDVGKAYSHKNFGNFHGHEKCSEIQARIILNRMRYSKDVIDQVARLCALHMYDMRGDTREAKVRVFVAKNYDVLDKLVALIRADRLATGMMSAEAVAAPHRFELVREKLIAEGAPILKRSLRISGKDLSDMGFEGEAISAALEFLWRECVICPTNNNAEWLKKMAERLPREVQEQPQISSKRR
ncbi:MAG: HD domain-containing protein, partial [Clostridiales bacterium]|nr:HD domain-containing protein [Clostridiales bacterium]